LTIERRPRPVTEGLVAGLGRPGGGGGPGEYTLGEGVSAESILGIISTLEIREVGGIVKGGNMRGVLGGRGGRDLSLRTPTVVCLGAPCIVIVRPICDRLSS